MRSRRLRRRRFPRRIPWEPRRRYPRARTPAGGSRVYAEGRSSDRRLHTRMRATKSEDVACSTAPFQMRLTDYLKQFGDFSSGGLFFLPVCLCRMGTFLAESKKNLERLKGPEFQRSRFERSKLRSRHHRNFQVQVILQKSVSTFQPSSSVPPPRPASLGCSEPSRSSPPSRPTSANTSSVEKMFLLYL